MLTCNLAFIYMSYHDGVYITFLSCILSVQIIELYQSFSCL